MEINYSNLPDGMNFDSIPKDADIVIDNYPPRYIEEIDDIVLVGDSRYNDSLPTVHEYLEKRKESRRSIRP